MTAAKIVHITDLSSAALDDTCSMKYWLHNFEGGYGIVPKNSVLPQRVLDETRQDIRTIASTDLMDRATIQVMVREILDGLTEEDKRNTKMMELLYRRLGWFVAYAFYIEPIVRQVFDVVEIPDEVVLDNDPLWIVVASGRLLRNRANGSLVYRLYKPTSTTGQKWIIAQSYDVDLHIGMQAVAEHLTKDVKLAQVVGMYTGYVGMIDHKLKHPYTYGRYNTITGMWSNVLAETRGDGWIDRPIWEYPTGIVGWVIFCGMKIALEQFPITDNIAYNQEVVTGWSNRRLHRERHLRGVTIPAHNNKIIRNIHFGRKTRACVPDHGPDCEYLDVCWRDDPEKTAIIAGDYVSNPKNTPT